MLKLKNSIAVGMRFGRLTVLSCDHVMIGGYRAYRCKCDCGNERWAKGTRLRSGEICSCGCIGLEQKIKAHKTHGSSNTKAWRAWAAMRKRCQTTRDDQYKRWAGRGITVCERWNTFENFFADMGSPPSEQHSIDRINNDGNYEPGNCRWATRKQQSRNTRLNIFITLNGQVKCLQEWVDHFGIKYATAWRRFREGWPKESIFLSGRHRKPVAH